jgi:SAM-dependent methyltransferase
MAELLLGCGNHREKILRVPDGSSAWTDLTTVDIDPNCGADIEWNLENLPLPFDTESMDEIHAYHTLEHVGRQGDARFFFAQFSDFWRILKPGGVFCGIVPAPGSGWVFGDPGHARFLPPEVLTFLDQTEYDRQVGVTAFADYRYLYRADFETLMAHPIDPDQLAFVLRAVKPSRISR